MFIVIDIIFIEFCWSLFPGKMKLWYNFYKMELRQSVLSNFSFIYKSLITSHAHYFSISIHLILPCISRFPALPISILPSVSFQPFAVNLRPTFISFTSASLSLPPLNVVLLFSTLSIFLLCSSLLFLYYNYLPLSFLLSVLPSTNLPSLCSQKCKHFHQHILYSLNFDSWFQLVIEPVTLWYLYTIFFGISKNIQRNTLKWNRSYISISNIGGASSQRSNLRFCFSPMAVCLFVSEIEILQPDLEELLTSSIRPYTPK